MDRFLSPGELRELATKSNVHKEILAFYYQYLASTNPLLGRTGAVCPFIPFALKYEKIFTLVDYRCEAELDLRDIFQQIQRDLRQHSDPLHSYVIFFPSISKVDFVGQIQRMFKRQFVSVGLMIGEFFQGNQSTGLHNKVFFPLQSKIPCLAFRHMVKEDIVFMDKAEYSSIETAIFKFHFYKRFPLIFLYFHWLQLSLCISAALALYFFYHS